MNEFNIGDKVEFNDGILRGVGIIVEFNTYCKFEPYLIELQGPLKGYGHNGNGESNRPYTTNDYWWLDKRNMKLLEE